ncbi:MAG: DNA/RNA non-specific endonuclease, partial [Bacteroides sp.]|nr:DNA/RNA non-specific endonuclease [Bacteroides sp.]
MIAFNSVLLAVLTLCASACSQSDPEIPSQPNEAFWKISSTVSFAEGSSAIIITGTTGTEWSA